MGVEVRRTLTFEKDDADNVDEEKQIDLKKTVKFSLTSFLNHIQVSVAINSRGLESLNTKAVNLGLNKGKILIFFPRFGICGFPCFLWGYSQNFVRKFLRFFVTLGLKISRLLRQKVVFEAYVMKG